MTNGKIIDGRYEIIEEIGRGGMAIVYLAKCLVLNRYVAIKVLRPEFRGDEEFIKRFKIESQSAGNLSHPNIVSVYDVGNEGDTEYIVMEYVEGITLKQYLGAKGSLPEKEAVDFASQICSGLEHAHKKGIVHKDIKPENIMITKEGILKITDFGIAKALNQGTITTGGLAMGSVHYFSPEQARGSFVDAKTDIYSLGVILYEMVTGRRPFDGENAISVAMQHIESEPVRPAIINSNVSISLDAVILKAMKKDTFERYQSATQMLIDLKKVSVGSDIIHTREKKNAEGEGLVEVEKEEVSRGGRQAHISKDKKSKKKKNKKSSTWSVVAGVAAAVVLVIALGAIYIGVFKSGGSNEIKAPDFVGMTYEEVMKTLEEKEYKKLTVALSDGTKIPENMEGVVTEQTPKGNKTIKNTAKIQLIFGEEPKESVPVPDVEGRTESDAIEALEKAGFRVKIDYEASDDIPEERVVRTRPAANTKVPVDSEITIYLSNGTEDKYTRVPGLIGITEAQAEGLLKDADLVLGSTKSVESDKKAGTIISQSRDEGDRIEKGSAIDVEISKGPKEEPDGNENAGGTVAPVNPAA